MLIKIFNSKMQLSRNILDSHFLQLKILLLHSGFCPEFRNILNGKVSHVTPQVGKAAIEFRCANNSFQLVGKTRLECIDGRWNGKLPYCQSKLSRLSQN